MSDNRRAPLKATVTAGLLAGVIATAAGLFAATAQAEPQNTNTPANAIHPNILSNGATNDNASPDNEGGGQTADNGLHGIDATPGQGGADPSGQGGFADSLDDVHGGMSGVNPVAAGTLP